LTSGQAYGISLFFIALVVLTVVFVLGYSASSAPPELSFWSPEHFSFFSTFILFVSLVGVFVFSGYGYLINHGPPPSLTNSTIESQRRLIAKSIRMCERELIVYSGEFHHDVYDHPVVLDALRSLSHQSVHLYCQYEKIDDRSSAFIEFLQERQWDCLCDLKTTQAHFLIVDRTDCRVEFHNGVRGGAQFARYFPGRQDFCRSLLRNFRANVVKRNPRIDISRLPTIEDDYSAAA